MAKRTPLAIEKDAGEIFNILYSEENSSTLSVELECVEELELVFLPPNDGKDSDKDDAPSDAEEGSANIKDVGRGVLSQSAEIRAITADEKKDIELDPNVSEPINTFAKQPKKKSKRRHWVEKELSLSWQAYKIPNDLDKPDIAKAIEDIDLSPVDMLKCALMRISWNTSVVNHRSMLLKKVSHNTKYQLRNCTSILEYCSSLVM